MARLSRRRGVQGTAPRMALSDAATALRDSCRPKHQTRGLWRARITNAAYFRQRAFQRRL